MMVAYQMPPDPCPPCVRKHEEIQSDPPCWGKQKCVIYTGKPPDDENEPITLPELEKKVIFTWVWATASTTPTSRQVQKGEKTMWIQIPALDWKWVETMKPWETAEIPEQDFRFLLKSFHNAIVQEVLNGK